MELLSRQRDAREGDRPARTPGSAAGEHSMRIPDMPMPLLRSLADMHRATAIEYGLCAGLIAAAAVTVAMLGSEVQAVFTGLGTAI